MTMYKCPKCGESKNLHYNYDLTKQHRPILDVLCNNCGEFFDGDIPVSELPSKESLIDRIEVINHANNHHQIGRLITLHKELGDFKHIDLSYQDDGKTLKIFIS